jgi:CheY-like chemotaxis protein
MERGSSNSEEVRARGIEQVLERILDLKELITNDTKNPILKLVEQCAAEANLGADSHQIAAAFRHCVIDLLRGRLRKLEDELSMYLRESKGAGTNCASSTILLVEDDSTWIELGKYTLEENGYKVAVASSADELGSVLRRTVPALILMDVHLGSDNGIQLVRCIRKGTVCPKVPIIMVTSDRLKETVRKAAHLRIQDYLLKPYVPADLLSKVKKHVQPGNPSTPVAAAAVDRYVE